MIDILVPVLSRPRNAALLVDSVEKATKCPYNILFLCSLGDTEQINACRKTKARIEVVPWSVGRSDYPKKMNHGLRMTKGEFILMGADDLVFEQDWDKHVLDVARQTEAGVVGTNDCANGHVKLGYFSTHALVRRSYAEQQGASLDGPGTLVSESYDHNYCDRELCHLAESRGLWAFAADSQIRHRHPLWRTAADDSTYAKGREAIKEDQVNFYSRAARWNGVGIRLQEKHKVKWAARKRA